MQQAINWVSFQKHFAVSTKAQQVHMIIQQFPFFGVVRPHWITEDIWRKVVNWFNRKNAA